MELYELYLRMHNMLLSTSYIIVFIMAIRLLLLKAPKVYSYMLWSVVLFRLLCPVAIASPISFLNLIEGVTVGVTESGKAEDVWYSEHILYQEGEDGSAAYEVILGQLESVDSYKVSDNVMRNTYIWLAGMCIMLAYNIFVYIRLRHKLVGAVPLRENIYLSDYITVPFASGFIHPRIYIPSYVEEKEREYIIRHEQCHITRHDNLIKLVAFLTLCIHWQSPFVWGAYILAMRDMEMSCDEHVVKSLGEDIREDYANSILSFATGRNYTVGVLVPFSQPGTKARIRNLVEKRKNKKWIRIASLITCVMAFAVCFFNPQANLIVNATDQDACGEAFSPYQWTKNVRYSDIHLGDTEPEIYPQISTYPNKPDKGTRRVLTEAELKELICILNGIPAGKIHHYAHLNKGYDYNVYFFLKNGEDILIQKGADTDFVTITGSSEMFSQYGPEPQGSGFWCIYSEELVDFINELVQQS